MSEPPAKRRRTSGKGARGSPSSGGASKTKPAAKKAAVGAPDGARRSNGASRPVFVDPGLKAVGGPVAPSLARSAQKVRDLLAQLDAVRKSKGKVCDSVCVCDSDSVCVRVPTVSLLAGGKGLHSVPPVTTSPYTSFGMIQWPGGPKSA